MPSNRTSHEKVVSSGQLPNFQRKSPRIFPLSLPQLVLFVNQKIKVLFFNQQIYSIEYRVIFKVKAQKLASANKIADLNNLKDDRVYLFSGSNDRVVKTVVVDKVKDFYQAAGLPSENIKYDKNINAGHAIIVEESRVSCSDTKSPFINDCDFMQSHRILGHIYGKLNPPVDSNRLSGKIIRFDQNEFIDGKKTSMSREAYVYVPEACKKESCKVHVAIHGCKQGAKQIDNNYYSKTGYNEIADSNSIIVLYPQVEPSASIPYNPRGCWDFWGY